MPGTLLTITDAGRAALIAPANAGTLARRVAEIGLSTAPFDAQPDLRKLPGERKRVTTFAGTHIGKDTVHVTIKDDSDDTFTLHGFGLYLDDGTLFAAYGQPTPIMEKSPAAILLLSADVHFASIDTGTLHFGDASFMNPPASTERQGVIELATQAEAAYGEDDSRAITAATLKPLLAKKADLAGATFTGPVTMKKPLRFAASPGPEKNYISQGSDGASRHANNLAIRSWWGVGFGTTREKTPVPSREFSHWFDTRNGDASFRGILQVEGFANAKTPDVGDRSRKLATTEFVVQAIQSAAIGQIVLEARATARAGFLKLNGALLQRRDYPALWAYAQGSGTLLFERDWLNGRSACFSLGDEKTTFRIPELRGEFLRCWDDERGLDTKRVIGSMQENQNQAHGHFAHVDPAGNHVHGAWTDRQGGHEHDGRTSHFGDHQHIVPWGEHLIGGLPPWGVWNGGDKRGAAGMDWDNLWYMTSPSGGHDHTVHVGRAGDHVHPVGMHAAGAHRHDVSIAADGGNEARPRNVALLAMIRAF